MCNRTPTPLILKYTLSKKSKLGLKLELKFTEKTKKLCYSSYHITIET
jgi:hypothetical protein